MIKTTLTRKWCEAGSDGNESGDHGSGDDGPGGKEDGGGFHEVGPRDPSNPFQWGPGPKFCPGYEGGGSWDAKPDIVGKTYAEAIPIAAEHGCTIGIVRIDGEDQIVTSDLRYERLRVEVEGLNRLITAISSVG